MSGFLAKNILFLLPLCFPFSQERVMLLHIPFYFHELVILISFFSFIFSNKKPIFPKKNVLFSVALLLFGIISSLWWNIPSEAGFGILKSWFLFPILAAFLFFQYFSRWNDQLKFFVAWFAVSVLVAIFSVAFPLVGQWTYDGRLKSFFLSPNHLAMFLEPGVLLGMFFLASAGRTSDTKKYVVIFSGTAVIVSAIILSRSDAAIVSLLVGNSFLLLLSRMSFQRAFRIGSVVVLFLGIVASVYLSVQWPAFSSGEVRSSLASRIMIWNTSGQMILDHPIFGIGPGRYEETYLAYQDRFPLYLEWAVPHPHNIFLAFWLNTGLIGLIGFLLVISAVFRIIFSSLKHKEGTVFQERLFYHLFAAFFIVFLIHGLVDTPYFKNEYALFFWIFVSFSIMKDRRVKTDILLK